MINIDRHEISNQYAVEVLTETGWSQIRRFRNLEVAVEQCHCYIVNEGEVGARVVEDNGNISYECYQNNMLISDEDYEEAGLCRSKKEAVFDWMKEGF